MHLIAAETTPYNEITIYETNQLFGRTGRYRCLRFADEAVQGALDLRDPSRVVLEYPRAMMHLMERNIPAFDRAFMIGHGIGTIASRYPENVIKIAEIDERVAAVSRQYFNYPHNNIIIGDGREWLSKQEADVLDFVIVDAFTHTGTPRHLTTLEFFRLAKERLHNRGILLLNLAGKLRQDWRASSIYTTLAEAFQHTASYFLPESPGVELGNILLAGSEQPISADFSKMAGFQMCLLERGHVILD